MRKLAILFFLTVLSIGASAQAPVVRFSSFYDGYWGEWHGGDRYKATGTYNDFVVYHEYNHPSKYYYKIKFNVPNANNGEIPKKEKKRRLKNNEWYEYEGTIEFYLNENYSLVEHWIEGFGKIGNNVPYRNGGKYNILKTYPCTIKIAPYKDSPRTYNVYFDKFGIAFIINS